MKTIPTNIWLESGKFGFCKYIASKFGFYSGNGRGSYTVMDKELEKANLNAYLEGIVGTNLFKEDKIELIHRINLRVDGKLLRSYSKLNEGLKMINLPFTIIPKKSMNNRYWIVEKVEL